MTIKTRATNHQQLFLFLKSINAAIKQHKLFVGLLLLATTLRAIVEITYRPDILFYGDSYFYIQDAHTLLPGSFHPAGYSFFLWLFLWTNKPAFATIAQHVLVLATACVIYAFILKLGLKKVFAVVAVLPILFDSYIINTESILMSETLTLVLYTLVLIIISWEKPNKRWQLISAGLLFAFVAITRSSAIVGLLPIVLFIIFNHWHKIHRLGDIIRPLGLFLAAALIPIVAYSGYDQIRAGSFSIDKKTSFFLYARLAQVASCQGLSIANQKLCDVRPISQRQNTSWYMWAPNSPLRTYDNGPAYDVNLKPLTSFDEQVLQQQWPTYIRSVAVETLRFFKPTRTTTIRDDPTKDIRFPTSAHWTTNTFLGNNSFTAKSAPSAFPSKLPHQRIARLLSKYYQPIYLPTIILGIGSIVTIVVACIKRNRWSLIASLFTSFALLQIIATAAAASLNYRYFIPVEELLWIGLILSTAALLQGEIS